MTIRANLVPFWRGLLLSTMAAGAGRGLRSGMWFMTARATRVTRLDQTCLSLVAASASNLIGLRVVRQAAMATGTSLVPLVQRDLLHARLVAARAGRRHVAQCELECVRLMAAGARGAAVGTAIRFSELVARRASADLHAEGNLSGVRIVTAHTSARLHRVVGVNVLVTRGASCRRRRADIVRRVAVGASAVRRDASAADHVQLRVAIPARRDLLFFECVRLVTADALSMAARKQCGCRNDRLLFRVTRDASCDRIPSRCVALCVAGRAGFNERFPLRSVARADPLMAIRAGSRLRRSLVGMVTAETWLAAVNRHRSERALLHAVAALAVRRLVARDGEPTPAESRVDRASVDRNARRLGFQRFFAAGTIEREGMTVRTHGFGPRAEVLGGFRRCVLDTAFFLVTRGAAIRRHWTHLVCGRSVAFHAFYFLILDVNAMAGHVARETPGLVDVNARSPLPILKRCFLAVLRRIYLVRAGG